MIEHDKGCKFSCEQKREDEVYLIAPVFLHLDCSSVSNAFFLGEKKKCFSTSPAPQKVMEEEQASFTIQFMFF